MAEKLYALGDIGATNLRIGVYDSQSELIGLLNGPTDPYDYEGTVEHVADTIRILTERRGEVVGASIAVAAEVNESGVLTKSGGLTPWVGKNLGEDLETALDLPPGLVGTPNDVVAIALSQQEINRRNGRPTQGIATTLSSGWGGALYWGKQGVTKSDEPGHEHLRSGAICTCGQDGHVEAYISGGGVKINQGLSMGDWLKSVPGASQQLVTDISTATISMIERHEAGGYGFRAEEIRWAGGVALQQPFIMRRVADVLWEYFGPRIAVDTVTMGDQAGLHGTFIDARRRAEQH